MLVSKNFKKKARAALSGKWAVGVGTGFVASLLGAGTIIVGSTSSGNSSVDPNTLNQLSQEELALLLGILMVVSTISLLCALIHFIIGGPITLGYVKFNLNLVDFKEARFSDLFSQFHRFGEGFLVQFLRGLFSILWTMVFLLPALILVVVAAALETAGRRYENAVFILLLLFLVLTIVAVCLCYYKQFSYSMSAYILYENPGMGANNAIKESIQLMKGNKWRLFCLNFSFIGWAILCLFTLGIGLLWLKPYQEASYAAFYREIKRERYGEPVQTTYTNPYEQSSSFNTYKDSNF